MRYRSALSRESRTPGGLINLFVNVHRSNRRRGLEGGGAFARMTSGGTKKYRSNSVSKPDLDRTGPWPGELWREPRKVLEGCMLRRFRIHITPGRQRNPRTVDLAALS